jgi:hypothetical protein
MLHHHGDEGAQSAAVGIEEPEPIDEIDQDLLPEILALVPGEAEPADQACGGAVGLALKKSVMDVQI